MVTKENVLKLTNLELAFQRLKFSPHHIHKDLYYSVLKDIEPFREEYFELLNEKFSLTDRLKNLGIARTYLPKKGGFVRPITYIGFEALLIYQAIANKLAESFYSSVSRNYNKITFGNHFNANCNSKFVLLPWKKRWKSYRKVSRNLIEERGFNYVVEFDIASFYDSIDHKLLMKCLSRELEKDIADILLSILQFSHSDFEHIKPGSGSGIPQGPIASIILSEIFLDFYIDQYFLKQMQRNEIAYIRYADDIRVFSQSKVVAKKFVTLLDLLCRNSGLIPQPLKVGVSFYENSRELIDQDVNKFSQIQNQYKKSGKLKSKVYRNALNLIKEMLKTGKFNKTKFAFYIYKLDKDDELRDLILANITEWYEFCDQMLFYLKKHYADDEDTISKLIDLFIIKENFFLDYPVYLFLDKFCSYIQFSAESFLKLYNRRKAGKWLSKVSLIRWALHWRQKDILLSLDANDVENILLKRELLCSQYTITDNLALKKQMEIRMLKDEHADLSFKAVSLIYERLLFDSGSDLSFLENIRNPVIEKILKGSKHNPVADTLTKQDIITRDPTTFFSDKIFSNEHEFEQLSVLCNFSVNYFQDKNYKLFIDSLDQFNQIVVERLFCLENGNRSSVNFGALLKNESFISTDMIGVRDILSEIHQLRNGELHPKNIKTGKFYPSNRVFEQKDQVMKKIFPEWLNAIEEILAWYDRKAALTKA